MATIGKVYRSGKALILFIDMPFLGSEKFLLLENKEKSNDNDPVFKIIKKTSLGVNVDVGAIWEKISDKGNPYKSGQLDHPLAHGGKINFAVFNLDEPQIVKGKDEKERKIIATVSYSAPKPKKDDEFGQKESRLNNQPQQQATQQQTQTTVVYDANGNVVQEIDIDEEIIPF